MALPGGSGGLIEICESSDEDAAAAAAPRATLAGVVEPVVPTAAHQRSEAVQNPRAVRKPAAEATPAAEQTSGQTAAGQWASGVRVLIVPLGSASAARRAIWTQQVQAAGGVVLPTERGSLADGLRPSHLVVAAEVGRERLTAWAEGRGLQVLEVEHQVTTGWLVECIAREAKARECSFRWPVQEAAGHCPAKVRRAVEQRPGDDLAPSLSGSAGSSPSKQRNAAGGSRSSGEASPSKGRPGQLRGEIPEAAFGGAVTPGQERLLNMRAKFACQSEVGGQGPRNADLVAAFSKLHQHYEKVGDEWRKRSYLNAANVLRRLPFEVDSIKDLDRWELRALGKKTRDKIAEFLKTGQIGRAECVGGDTRTRALEDLQDIWGVGLTTARLWMAKGCRTVEDVRSRASELGLSSDQLVGLRYYEEFRQRMPRSEASEIIEVVREAVQRLFGSRLRMEPCGSYRRGAQTCGDVDVLFTHDRDRAQSHEDSQDVGSEQEILAQIVAALGGFLTDHLKAGNFSRTEERQHTSATYFGVCQLGPGRLHRRIDLKVYPNSEWPFALLSFTGSGHFNRSMRLYARRAGFSLSDHDIRPANHARGQGRGLRIWTGRPIETFEFREERDIFDFLGLLYREPNQREVDAAWLDETAAPGAAGPSLAERPPPRGPEPRPEPMVPRSLQPHPSVGSTALPEAEDLVTELDEDSEASSGVEFVESAPLGGTRTGCSEAPAQ